jgi:hypothetical protein
MWIAAAGWRAGTSFPVLGMERNQAEQPQDRTSRSSPFCEKKNMGSQSRLLPLCVAGVALAASLAFAWSEYRIATADLPAPDTLVTIEGDLGSCSYDTLSLLDPSRTIYGGWGGGHSYLFTIKGQDRQFRTSVYGCGGDLQPQAASFPTARRVSFAVMRGDNASSPAEAELLLTYGFAVNGEVLRRVEDDLDLHRRAHDVVSPLNTAGFMLLACIAPVWIYRAARRRARSPDVQTLTH